MDLDKIALAELFCFRLDTIFSINTVLKVVKYDPIIKGLPSWFKLLRLELIHPHLFNFKDILICFIYFHNVNGNCHFVEISVPQIPMDTCTLYGIMTVVALKNILKSKNKILTNKSFEGYSYTVISDTLGSSFFCFLQHCF